MAIKNYTIKRLNLVENPRTLGDAELSADFEVCDDKDQHIVTVCRAGMRSASAAAILTAMGFRQVENLSGGMLAWTDAGLRVVDRKPQGVC